MITNKASIQMHTIMWDKFTLDIGKLPIESQYLRSGLGVEIKIVATRTFAGYTDQQTITVTDVLGPFR